MRICSIVGARPQFVKAAVVSRALEDARVEETLVHTGQHYDAAMSQVFFEDLDLPEPTVNLGVGSGTHAEQTGAIMTRLEAFIHEQPPFDGVLVYGDTNSTLAAALVAAKLHLPLAHVEAGLRSFNRAMAEEVNRIVTDRLATHCYCPSQTAVRNLAYEGITDGVYQTGDVMYDALLHYLPLARERYPVEHLVPSIPGDFLVLTLHRAENVDHRERFEQLLQAIAVLGAPVVWPQHPRARMRMDAFGLDVPDHVYVTDPVGYLQMLALLDGAQAVLTDSGGVQKEAYWSRTPCVTLRPETEWVETVEAGWNVVADADPARMAEGVRQRPQAPPAPHYGDGTAARTIAQKLQELVSSAQP